MNSKKTKSRMVMTYQIGESYRPDYLKTSRDLSDVEIFNVYVTTKKKIDPSEELETAAGYDEKETNWVKEKIARANKLGIKHWYETGFRCDGIDLCFSRIISTGQTYACKIERMTLQKGNIDLLMRIMNRGDRLLKKKHGSHARIREIESLDHLMEILTSLKAVPIKYDPDYANGQRINGLGEWYDDPKGKETAAPDNKRDTSKEFSLSL